MIMVNFILLIRKGEELKAPHYASVAATRDHVTTRDIFPTLAILLLWVAYVTIPF